MAPATKSAAKLPSVARLFVKRSPQRRVNQPLTELISRTPLLLATKMKWAEIEFPFP
jgi:hypothetical protein